MIPTGEIGLAGLGALLVVPVKDDDTSALIRLLVFAVIFIGPAIFKAIRESARKKKELAERATGRLATQEVEAAPEEEEEEEEAGTAAAGRDQWERLLRGEGASPPPIVPPPLPQASNLERAPRRRVLTETRALTEEEALTDTPALTDVRPVIVAQPEVTIQDPTGYDGVNRPKLGLGREFADFAPQEGLASDREGGPAKRVGARATFAGAGDFQSLTDAGAPSEVSQREIGLDKDFDVTAGQARGGRRFSRAHLRRSLVLAEILGPPVGFRPLESGPTRPLGWS